MALEKQTQNSLSLMPKPRIEGLSYDDEFDEYAIAPDTSLEERDKQLREIEEKDRIYGRIAAGGLRVMDGSRRS